MINSHEFYINKCIDLAKKQIGLVSPNPLVGSLIVKNNLIISQGSHKYYGGPHAEVDAINNATEILDGSTLYCNLEPCCHTKKQTPPCVDLILKNKISKVIIGCLDPNPLVAGLGAKKLEENGVKVKCGILKKDCELLNQIFFKFIQTKIPYIHLKMATTLDGKIAERDGNSKWITNDLSRVEVHKLRLTYDGVAVGINTVIADNPSLTIRMGIKSNNKIPYKIIFGFREDIFNLNIFKNNPERLIIISSKVNTQSIKLLNNSGSIVINKIKLEAILFEIGKLNISSILVEGGAKLFSTFIKESLYDKLSIFSAPIFKPNGISLLDSDIKSENFEILNPTHQIIGNNILTNGVNHVYRSC